MRRCAGKSGRRFSILKRTGDQAGHLHPPARETDPSLTGGAGAQRWRESAAERPCLRLRLRVAARRDDLDLALAGGADPTASADLALRAARLVRERKRRGVARCLRLAIWEAEAGASALRVSPRPVCRAAVLTDRDALLLLTERLESPRPAGPEGVAIAERLLTDLRSPLFVWAEPGTIRRLAHVAAAAMDR